MANFDIIVAYAEHGRAIGRDGGIPWDRLPTDMKFFAQATRGGTIIMGRKTYASLPNGRPLPGRRNIVVSTTACATDYPQNVVVVPSLDAALAVAATCPNVWVIGGERLYDDALRHTRLRRVHATVIANLRVADADAHFPELPAGVLEPDTAMPVTCDAEGWTRTTYVRQRWQPVRVDRLAYLPCSNPACTDDPLMIGTYKVGPRRRSCTCGRTQWRTTTGSDTRDGWVGFEPGQVAHDPRMADLIVPQRSYIKDAQ